MEQDRQTEFFRAGEHVERFRPERIEVLVVRTELDAAQAEIAGGSLDFLERVWIVGMDGQESEELFRVRPHECRGVVVGVAGRVNEVPVIRLTDARIGGDVEHDRSLDARHRLDVLVPGVRGRRALIGSPQVVEGGVFFGWRSLPARRVVVNVDDAHRANPFNPTRSPSGLFPVSAF